MAPNAALAFGIAGSITSTLMYLSPLKAVYGARLKGSLGPIEPRPFAFSVLCCASWIAYGFISHDFMMFEPNVAGILVSMFNCMAAFSLADRSAQNFMMAILCFASVLIPMVGIVAVWGLNSDARAVMMGGLVADIITVAYYGSPLAAAWNVIKQRDSAPIMLPRLACDMMNSGLWLAYGFMKMDPFIIVPNGLGFFLGCCLAVLKAAFYRRAPRGADPITGPAGGGVDAGADDLGAEAVVIVEAAGEGHKGAKSGDASAADV